jgi:hypothetical protein
VEEVSGYGIILVAKRFPFVRVGQRRVRPTTLWNKVPKCRLDGDLKAFP